MNGRNGDDIGRIADYCEQVLDLSQAKLSNEYFYQSLPLCMIDAVFSLGARYEGTRETVKRYCDYFHLERIRKDKKVLPPKEDQESVESFQKKMESFGFGKFANEIFRNRQRTSTRAGILKSEAVLRFASVLSKFGVNYFQDVSKVVSDEMFEKEIMNIPGQTSGLSLGYFFMLSGSNEFIKPDRMVLRFLETALERRVSPGEAKELVTKAVSNLRSSYPDLTPRLLDNEMWRFQRGEPVNKIPIPINAQYGVYSNGIGQNGKEGKMDGLQQHFGMFLRDQITLPMGGRLSGEEWIRVRKETYDIFRIKFCPAQVNNLLESDFHHFLTSKGNMSWTNLPRGCKRVTQEMRRLKNNLVYLQNEEIPVEDRLNAVLSGGKFYIKGFGRNLATGLLHVFNWQKYGVWNNRSQKVLTQLRRLPYISYSNLGQSYSRFNSELQKLARELETDLVNLDGFLWWLDENKRI